MEIPTDSVFAPDGRVGVWVSTLATMIMQMPMPMPPTISWIGGGVSGGSLAEVFLFGLWEGGGGDGDGGKKGNAVWTYEEFPSKPVYRPCRVGGEDDAEGGVQGVDQVDLGFPGEDLLVD